MFRFVSIQRHVVGVAHGSARPDFRFGEGRRALLHAVVGCGVRSGRCAHLWLGYTAGGSCSMIGGASFLFLQLRPARVTYITYACCAPSAHAPGQRSSCQRANPALPTPPFPHAGQCSRREPGGVTCCRIDKDGHAGRGGLSLPLGLSFPLGARTYNLPVLVRRFWAFFSTSPMGCPGSM